MQKSKNKFLTRRKELNDAPIPKKKKEKVLKGRKHVLSNYAKESRARKVRVKAELEQSGYTNTHPYKVNDIVIILRGIREDVALIEKLVGKHEVYVSPHRGKASQNRDKWVMSIEGVLRKATAEEIRKAELKG